MEKKYFDVGMGKMDTTFILSFFQMLAQFWSYVMYTFPGVVHSLLHSTMACVHCSKVYIWIYTVYGVQISWVYRAQFTPHGVQFKEQQWTVNTEQFTYDSLQHIKYRVKHTVYKVQNSVQETVYSVQWKWHTVQSKVYILQFTAHVVQSTAHSLQST